MYVYLLMAGLWTKLVWSVTVVFVLQPVADLQADPLAFTRSFTGDRLAACAARLLFSVAHCTLHIAHCLALELLLNGPNSLRNNI